MAPKAPAAPAAAAAAWACLLFLLAVSCGCRLALATGRGALAADTQAASSSYDHDYQDCRDDGALCTRAKQCCSGTCLQHTCWSNPHQRPPCRQHHEQCLDSEDCCGALVCRHAHGHRHPVCRVCPFVRVAPPSAPVVICESLAATSAAVAFTVATDTNATLNVPPTIAASDGRVCSLNGSTTGVPSGTTVCYACPQLGGTWTPATFTLTLTASAGPADCASTGSAVATVAIRPSTCTRFSFALGGWQNATVPQGVTSSTIDAYGAQGKAGEPTTVVGGKGARMSGAFTVSPGDNLIILVGGEGQQAGRGECTSGGGGGGTFVVREDPASPDVITSGPFIGKAVTPLVVAGGGGGCRSGEVVATAPGNPGVTGLFGTTSSGGALSGGGVPKTSGAGEGGGAVANYGSGGGGFRTNGQNDTTSNILLGTGGAAFLSGGAGGQVVGFACAAKPPPTIGGLGGGGGGGCCGGGGGGGYSGGDGGRVAGGGGSFNAGRDQLNAPGAQSGDGFANICFC